MTKSDFLIIEGCDGVGKSTLVELLVARGYKTAHFDYDARTMSIKDKYMRAYTGNFLNNPHVFDRSYISEHVYGPLFRGGSRLSDNDVADLSAATYANKGRIIYLKADPKAIYNRIKSRGNKDAHMDQAQIEQISQQYDKVITSIDHDVLVVDTSNLSIEQVLEKILHAEGVHYAPASDTKVNKKSKKNGPHY